MDLDFEIVQSLQHGHGGWADGMFEVCIRLIQRNISGHVTYYYDVWPNLKLTIQHKKVFIGYIPL